MEPYCQIPQILLKITFMQFLRLIDSFPVPGLEVELPAALSIRWGLPCPDAQFRDDAGPFKAVCPGA